MAPRKAECCCATCAACVKQCVNSVHLHDFYLRHYNSTTDVLVCSQTVVVCGYLAELLMDLFVQLSSCMSGLERLSCLLAAVCHDVDHPGLNQMFLVATDNPLVALYEVI